MFSKLEKVMGRVAEKLSTNKVLVAIRDGFLVATPLIIVASIFLVIELGSLILLPCSST